MAISVRCRSGPRLAAIRAARPVLLLLACLAVLAGQALLPVRAQVSAGATLTVLRGTAGVLRSDGAAISPAASGLALGPGDRVATVGPSAALVTFFDGTELELGRETAVIIRELSQEGSNATIGIQSVVGTTLHRVVALSDAGSTYHVEAGGTVALVRGTVFAHHVDASGDITVAVGDGDVEYPGPGSQLRRGEKRTVTSRGDVVTNSFDPSQPLFNVVTQPAASGNPSGTDNPGLGTGSLLAPQQQSLQQGNERDQPGRPSSRPGSTFLIAAAPSGTTGLEVASTEGFAVGDLVRIGTGPDAELAVVAGGGSIIVIERPLVGSFAAGAPVELVARPTPAATPAPTVTPTPTVGVVGTTVPSPTPAATSTQTPTSTATATSTQTPTVTPTPTFPCLGPLTRDLAPGGGGATGTTQAIVPGGVRLTVYVELIGASPTTAFDVYVDVSPSIADHRLVGQVITDGAGSATFTGAVVVPTTAALVDNELVLHGEDPTLHQYTRERFATCSE